MSASPADTTWMLDAVSRPSGAHLRSFLAAPLRPQTYLNLLYLALAFPLGVLYLVFVTIGLSLGIGLAIVLVGIPILVVVVGVTLGIAGFERWLAALLLGVDFGSSDAETDGEAGDVEASTGSTADAGDDEEPSAPRRVLSVLVDSGTWLAVAYLPVKFVLGVAGFLVMTVLLSTAVALLLAPLYYRQPGVYVGVVTDRPVELHPTLHLGWNRLLVTLEPAVTVGSWRITRLSEAVVVAVVGVVLLLVALHLLNGLAWLSGRLTRWMLGDSYDLAGTARRVVG